MKWNFSNLGCIKFQAIDNINFSLHSVPYSYDTFSQNFNLRFLIFLIFPMSVVTMIR